MAKEAKMSMKSRSAMEKKNNEEEKGLEQYNSSTAGKIMVLMIAISVSYWFYRNIGQMEREISMRTESGFYYSFYKHLVAATNFSNGLETLRNDERVEYPRRINSLRRFNIAQEQALALIYRILEKSPMRQLFPDWLTEPILFYVNCSFALSGLAMLALFLMAWFISGNWICGLLTSVWLIRNLDDTTRVFFTVNLRENFALPFFWLQTICAFIVLKENNGYGYGRGNGNGYGRGNGYGYGRGNGYGYGSALMGYFLFSFLFALFWQFNQFIFLLQSIAFYGLSLLRPSITLTVHCLLLIQTIAFLMGSDCEQKMTIGAFCISLTIAILLVDFLVHRRMNGQIEHLNDRGRKINGQMEQLNDRGRRLMMILVRAGFSMLIALLLNWAVKWYWEVDADTHIWSFVKAKLGISTSRKVVSFETGLYLCHGAFQSLDWGFYERQWWSGILPLYSIVVMLFLWVTMRELIGGEDRSRREYLSNGLMFIIAQSIVIGAVAMFTLRLKYIWSPLMAVLASWLLYRLLRWLCDRVVAMKQSELMSNAVLFIAIAMLISKHYPVYMAQMADEKEFYDPDTVALMRWIMENTRSRAVFTGSMQLLAGVHLCTGRYLTNHPHFEDRWLRDRTQRLYQVYGRKRAIEVRKIMRQEKVDYVILEDSLCMAPSNGCSTPDLVDLANGEYPDSGSSPYSGLIRSMVPRFCDEVRHAQGDYGKYFHLVFNNPTFRVYEIR